MSLVHGLHHVTAIAADPRRNVDFYTRVLGMRLVKRSVNQDDPGTYHLFYADADGSPGTDLTFFPWTQLAPAREGHGLAVEVALAVGPESLDFWARRLAAEDVRVGAIERRFDERVLPFRDPSGLAISLVEVPARAFAAWDRGPVPPEAQVRGLHSVRLAEHDLGASAEFLTGTLGFARGEADGEWQRFSLDAGDSGQRLEVRELRDQRRGHWGTGAVHHVAWRVRDEAEQLAVRSAIAEARRRPTEVIDRFWFKSVYFTEPGGVLFELATDGPGFTRDEPRAALGETLILPPWLEPHRAEIERALPPLPEITPAARG